MPLYEYRGGGDCKKYSTYLILQGHSSTLSCKHGTGQQLERIMFRVASPKFEEARMEALADPSNVGNVDKNDPKSLAGFMKKMGKEMGEDRGEEFDEAVETMGENGQEEDNMSIPDRD